jgi:hypothetical protein
MNPASASTLSWSSFAGPVSASCPVGTEETPRVATAVPQARANPQYLRALRAAELEAWKHADRTEAVLAGHVGTAAMLRAAARDDRLESWLEGLIVAGAATAVGYAMSAAFDLVERWPAFVELVSWMLA